jgi:hypothetical protein
MAKSKTNVTPVQPQTGEEIYDNQKAARRSETEYQESG